MGYVWAVVLTAAAAGVRWGLDPWVGDLAQYTLFYLTVAVLATRWGWRAGALGAVLGGAAAWLIVGYYLDRVGHATPVQHALQLGLYVVVSGWIVALAAWARRQRRESRAQAQELAETLKERTQLSTIVESTDDAIISKDLSGTVQTWNAAAERMFGYTAEEIIGKPIALLLPPERKGEEEEILVRLRRGERVEHMETVRVARDGRRMEMSITVSPLRDAEGRIVGASNISRDITERKRALAALRESEERFRIVAENARAIFGIIQGKRFVYANPYLSEISGYSLDEILAMDFADMVRPDFRDMVVDFARRRQLGEKVPGHYEFAMLTKSGETRWVEFSPGRFEYQGKPAIVGTAYDITARKRVEEALRGSEAKYRAIFEQAAIGMGRVRFADARWMDVNDAFCRMLGYSREEMRATPWPRMTHPEDVDVDLVPFRRMAAGELENYSVEKRFIHKQGHWVWARLTLSLVRDAAGRPEYEIAIVEDVTDRKRVEEALRKSEDTLSAVLDAMPVALIIADADGRIVRTNRANQELWGVTPETARWEQYGEWVGYWPETGRRVEAEEWAMTRALRTGETVTGDLVEIEQFGTGRRRFSLNNAAPVRDATGKIIAAVVAQLDVTDRIAAERALRESERRLRVFFESDMIGTIYWSMDGRITDANNKFLRMVGYSREDLEAGRLIWERMTPPEYKPLDEYALEELRKTGVDTPYEKEFIRKEGGRIPVIIGAAMLDDDRHGGVAFVLDITDRKRVEEELAAAKRSAERAKAAAEEASRSKDHFLAVLSHELRTPLTPVVTALAMLQNHAGLDDSIREGLEMIRRNVEMETRLIDDLLDVTRIARGKIELERKAIDLVMVVRRAVEVVQPDMEAKGLHFLLYAPDSAYIVDGDATRLQQVFWNLLRNAIKFTPSDGCVGVRCRHNDDGQVIVEISDSGEGIEAEAIGRIFNAFEQAERSITRQFGGLGLGLAISKALVEMHGGTIEADSAGKGKGAVFRVALPVVAARPSAEPPPPQALAATRPLSILLVEDHGDTARVLRQLLMLEGHRVERAADVATALELAGREKFDLIISDLGLPDRSGLEFMRELRSQGSRVPGIALSGYGQEEDVRRSREAGFAAHLTKPTRPERLAEAIAAATTAKPAAS